MFDVRIMFIVDIGSLDIYNREFDFVFFFVEINSIELMLMRGVVNYKDCVFDIFLKFVKNLLVY